MIPQRIQRSRAKGWQVPHGAVYVGRLTAWGNPWFMGNPGTIEGRYVSYKTLAPLNAEQAVNLYRDWLAGEKIPILALPEQTAQTAAMVAALREWLDLRRAVILGRIPDLRGRDLVCWCKPGSACHADVLLGMANG